MAEGRVKVIHVLTDRNIGGAGRWLLYYLKYHNRERFAVKVILPSDSLLISAVEALGVEVISMHALVDKSLDETAKKPLKAVFKEERPDVVHTHASLTARMAARASKVPLVINTKHCMEDSPGNWIKRIARRELNRIYSDKVVAVSKAVEKSMIAGGTSPKQIVVIYNGIDSIPQIPEGEKRAIRRIYSDEADKKAVGIVARLEEIKDHWTFLSAAKKVLDGRDDVHFYVVGDGRLKDELRTFCRDLKIENHVTFTGFVQDVEEIVQSMDISVITSKAEALCLSLIESMSAGVPVVGTDCGGVGEVIRHGETGFLVPIGDAGALAQKINMLLSDDEVYAQMSRCGIELAGEKFSAKEMVKKIERLYLEDKK